VHFFTSWSASLSVCRLSLSTDYAVEKHVGIGAIVCAARVISQKIVLKLVFANIYAAAAKEQNHIDQSTAFLAAARHKPGPGVTEVMEYKFKVNGSHVPGCGGGCSVASNGGAGFGTSFDAPASGLQQQRTAPAVLKKVWNTLSAYYENNSAS